MSLKDILIQKAEMWKALGHDSFLETFIIRNGVDRVGVPKPPSIRKLPNKACFKNATDLMHTHGFRYIEGFAMRLDLGIPMHHAWNEDAEGNLVDATWKGPEGGIYCGVHFTTDEVHEAAVRSGYYGVLLNGWIPNIRTMLAKDADLLDACPHIKKLVATGALAI